MNAQVFGDGALVDGGKVADRTFVGSVARVFVHVDVVLLQTHRHETTSELQYCCTKV